MAAGGGWVDRGEGHRGRAFVQSVGRFLRSAARNHGRLVKESRRGDHLLDIETLPDGFAWLLGYWQSPQYFAHIRSEICREFTLPVMSGSRIFELLQSVGARDSIAVHVRRGDYSSEMRLSASYYEKGLEVAAKKLSDPIAVVFGDDPEWAKKSLHLVVPSMHVEESAPLTALEAMALMSRCKHHVIANSTFSWWGAYLGQHEDQVVVRPERWFSGRPIDTAFRFPANWRVV